jgi:hypothetical protein
MFFRFTAFDAQGTTVLRKRLRRGQVLAFFSRIPRCVVGLEACATAHYWARELGALGHEVRLMPAQYVKAYIKRNKHDAADAEAICEAVGRGLAQDEPRQSAARQHSGDWADHRYGNRIHGGRPKCLSLRAGVRRLAGLGAAAEFNRGENSAGRDHETRQPLSAPAAHQWGKREFAAIEGDESRSVGDRVASAATAAGRRRCAGEQDSADRLGGYAAPE